MENTENNLVHIGLGRFFHATLILIGFVVLLGRFVGCLEVNVKHLDYAAEERAGGGE